MLLGWSLEQEQNQADQRHGGWANNVRKDRPAVGQQHDHSETTDYEQRYPDSFSGHGVSPSEFEVDLIALRIPGKLTAMDAFQEFGDIHAVDDHAGDQEHARNHGDDDQCFDKFLVHVDLSFLNVSECFANGQARGLLGRIETGRCRADEDDG